MTSISLGVFSAKPSLFGYAIRAPKEAYHGIPGVLLSSTEDWSWKLLKQLKWSSLVVCLTRLGRLTARVGVSMWLGWLSATWGSGNRNSINWAIADPRQEDMNLADFKAVMLSSLRSLLPKAADKNLSVGPVIVQAMFVWDLLQQNNVLYIIDRRKFGSQTSDNMDRWKAEQGRGREKRKIRRKKSRRERVRRKQMQMREKVGKSRNTGFFQWFGAPEGRKVGSLKRRVLSQLARWEMKKCTPLWREAHFEVKMYKTHQLRTTCGSWDVEKVHAVLA